jgi:hypothetical protein
MSSPEGAETRREFWSQEQQLPDRCAVGGTSRKGKSACADSIKRPFGAPTRAMMY